MAKIPFTLVSKRRSTATKPRSSRRDTGLFQPETPGERPPANRYQDDIAVDALGRAAAGGLDGNPHRVAAPLGAGHPGAGPERQPLSCECAGHLPRDLAVHRRQDPVEVFEHRHPGAQTAPDGAQLKPDIAAAADHEMCGHRREGKRAGRRQDARLVDVEPF